MGVGADTINSYGSAYRYKWGSGPADPNPLLLVRSVVSLAGAGGAYATSKSEVCNSHRPGLNPIPATMESGKILACSHNDNYRLL